MFTRILDRHPDLATQVGVEMFWFKSAHRERKCDHFFVVPFAVGEKVVMNENGVRLVVRRRNANCVEPRQRELVAKVRKTKLHHIKFLFKRHARKLYLP